MLKRTVILFLLLSGCTRAEPPKPFTCEILNKATSDLRNSIELSNKSLGSLLVIARDREDLREYTLHKLCMYYPTYMPGTDTKTCGLKDINDFLEQLNESRSASLNQLSTYDKQIGAIRACESKNMQSQEIVSIIQYLKSIISWGAVLFLFGFFLKLLTGQSNVIDIIKLFKKK